MGKKIYNWGPEAAMERAIGMGGQAARDAAALLVTRGVEAGRDLNEYPTLAGETASEGTERVTIDGLALSNVAISCSSSKHIVSTAINGMSGTVKEWVSNGDVAITMEIQLLSEDGSYPEEAVDELMAVVKKNESVVVASRLLNDVWDVQRVVVTGVRMSGQTERNWEEVTLSLLSDEEYAIDEEVMG